MAPLPTITVIFYQITHEMITILPKDIFFIYIYFVILLPVKNYWVLCRKRNIKTAKKIFIDLSSFTI